MAIWLLPTRGRPRMARRAIEACTKAGMTSPAVLFCDPRGGFGDEYLDIELPANWRSIHADYDMADAMRWCLERYPNEDRYGWLADDLRPKTPGFDKRLEEAAGDWYLADCHDGGYLSDSPSILSHALAGAFCWGGELVRTVGWWALPGVRQAGIDNAWVDLTCRTLHLRKYLPGVLVEHLHYRNGKRPEDPTDSWERDGVEYIEEDFEILEGWRNGDGLPETLSRLRMAITAAGVQEAP